MKRLASILLWSVSAAAFIGPGTVTTAASAGSSYGLALLWALFLFIEIPGLMLFPLLAGIGFTSGALIIGFATAREVNHPGAAGVVGGVVNMSVLGVAAIMQPVLGKILDAHWQGTLVEGVRVYNEAAYFSAFIWLLVSSALSIIMVLGSQETYCRIKDV